MRRWNKNKIHEKKEEDNFVYSSVDRSVDNKTQVRTLSEEWIFFRSVWWITIAFCPNFFCLWSEVPSSDLNGDIGNRSCWSRIYNFFWPNTLPWKRFRGDMSSSVHIYSSYNLSFFIVYFDVHWYRNIFNKLRYELFSYHIVRPLILNGQLWC